jgi:hypothetical protein
LRRKRPRWVQFVGHRGFHMLHRYGYFRYRPESKLSIEDYLQWTPLKIVGIIRNGQSVVSSVMRRGKQPKSVALHRWCRSIEILSELHAQHPKNYSCSLSNSSCPTQKIRCEPLALI